MINSVQLLRALAAFAVVLFHGRLLFDDSQSAWLQYSQGAALGPTLPCFSGALLILAIVTAARFKPAVILLPA